jgi:MFS family permease
MAARYNAALKCQFTNLRQFVKMGILSGGNCLDSAARRMHPLALICAATVAWGFSFGLGTQVTSHWLKAKGLGDPQIGLIHATYYLGLTLAAFAVPALMRRWRVMCPVVGLILSCLTLALFPLAGSLAGWFALRFLNGAAAGMTLIPLETLISGGSSPERRTRNFGIYAVALTFSGAAGIWAGLHFYTPGNTRAFYIGAAGPLFAALALARWLRWPGIDQAGPADQPFDLRRSFLSFGTAWGQGFLEGGMLAFLSFFLISLGLSADSAGALMGITMVGVIVFQIPAAWLGDRFGLIPVLLVCYALVAAGLMMIPLAGAGLCLAACLFLFGACSGAMYPLGLSLLGDKIADANLSRAYAWYMALECIGSQFGAAAMGRARNWWGEAAMFPVGLAAIAGVIILWLLVRYLGLALAEQSNDRTISRRAA